MLHVSTMGFTIECYFEYRTFVLGVVCVGATCVCESTVVKFVRCQSQLSQVLTWWFGLVNETRGKMAGDLEKGERVERWSACHDEDEVGIGCDVDVSDVLLDEELDLGMDDPELEIDGETEEVSGRRERSAEGRWS